MALLTDPEAPGLRAALERAAGSTRAVLGPAVELVAARQQRRPRPRCCAG